MDDDILARMEAEEATLTERLDAVRLLLAVYRGTARPKSSAQSSRKEAVTRGARPVAERMDKFGPYGKRIVEAVATLLPASDGNPVPTRKLVEYLTDLGVEITGENKVNSLSALLARSSLIKGHGRSGWTLHGDAAGSRYPYSSDSTGRNENEAPNGDAAGASEVGSEGAATPYVPFQKPQSWPGA